MAGNDFVFVQLTPQGAAQAGGHPLRVSGRTSIEFTAGIAQRVARYEWDLMLKNYSTSHGMPLFELVTETDPGGFTPFATGRPKDAPPPPLAAEPATPKESK